MEGLAQTALNAVKAMQTIGASSAAVCIGVVGFMVMFGGREGKQIGKGWFIGIILGMVCVFGAEAIAGFIQSNISF